jgi:hypothetical protein
MDDEGPRTVTSTFSSRHNACLWQRIPDIPVFVAQVFQKKTSSLPKSPYPAAAKNLFLTYFQNNWIPCSLIYADGTTGRNFQERKKKKGEQL